ncbi:hypothetical protein Angca_001692, partial [Angiostrongylus cantonensis]
QHLSCKILEHGGEGDWSSTSDTTSIVASAEHAMKATNGELQAGTSRTRLGLASSLCFTSFTTARHYDD